MKNILRSRDVQAIACSATCTFALRDKLIELGMLTPEMEDAILNDLQQPSSPTGGANAVPVTNPSTTKSSPKPQTPTKRFRFFRVLSKTNTKTDSDDRQTPAANIVDNAGKDRRERTRSSVREIPPRIRHQFSVIYEKSDSDTVHQSKLRRFVKIFQKSKVRLHLLFAVTVPE